MKKFIIAMTLGTVAGVLISEIPAVKSLIKKGKRKVKDMTD